jgi:hypothetical protein
MADEIAIETTRPTDPSLKKSKSQFGKTTSDATDKKRLAHRFTRRAKMANVIVDEIGNRTAQSYP